MRIFWSTATYQTVIYSSFRGNIRYDLSLRSILVTEEEQRRQIISSSPFNPESYSHNTLPRFQNLINSLPACGGTGRDWLMQVRWVEFGIEPRGEVCARPSSVSWTYITRTYYIQTGLLILITPLQTSFWPGLYRRCHSYLRNGLAVGWISRNSRDWANSNTPQYLGRPLAKFFCVKDRPTHYSNTVFVPIIDRSIYWYILCSHYRENCLLWIKIISKNV